MTRKKPIKLKYGCIIKLAEDCGTTVRTVRLALRYDADTPTQALIRQRARELDYIRKF